MIGVFPVIGCFNPDVVLLFVTVLYDGSGVPSVSKGKGIASVSDDGAGLFTIKTNFPWRGCLGGGHIRRSASANGGAVELVSEDAANRNVQIRCTNAAGSATDPANADGASVMLAFQCGGATPL